MPVVTCTKCPTQLRVPDGATGNVKCPKCTTIFPVGAKAAAAPAFEVVDDDPPPRPAARATAAAPAARPAPPPPPPASRKSEPESDFEFEDDDAPRKKRRRDDDDDDYRPRSRRRRDDDDDDYDDNRGRSRGRRRRRDRDDDDDYDDRPSARGNGYAAGKTGTLLMGIGLWLYVGMYGLLALFALLAMATSVSEGLFAIPGICGAACTVLLLIGVSFCIAGPQKARGMAIATVCVAGVHLVLIIICYSKVSGVRGGGFGGVGGGILGGGEWLFLGSVLWVLDLVLPLLIYAPKGASLGGEGILFLLAAACELARCILVCLTIRGQATAAKDYDAADKAGMGVMLSSIVTGAAAALVTVLVVIVIEGKMIKSAEYLAGLGGAVVCTGYALMTVPAALAALAASQSLGRKARRGG